MVTFGQVGLELFFKKVRQNTP